MAAELRIKLLGPPELTLGESDVGKRLAEKYRVLFFYLVMKGEPLSRDHLADALWGESTQGNARRSLRVALTKLRREVGLYLDTDRQSVAFLEESPFWLDVNTFEYLLQRGEQIGGASARAFLREAVELYRGEFLTNVDVEDAPIYQEWILPERERLRQLALDALDELVKICIEQEDTAAGITYARQLLDLESWREAAHRQLMWLLALDGQRTAALMQYETCKNVLYEEFGVGPSPETEDLYQRIREMAEGEPLAKTEPLPPIEEAIFAAQTPFLAPPPPPHFLGRDGETAVLTRLLTGQETTPICCLSGMGGVGKTALAIHVAHTLREQFPDGVLWANVNTKEPLAIAEDWAQAYGYSLGRMREEKQLLDAVRALLSEKRALLVFDDVTVAARVRSLIPVDGQCAVLVTTRNGDLAAILNARLVKLHELSPERGLSLLQAIIGEERIAAEKTAAAEITALLHHLPLAVAIAGQRLATRPRRKLVAFVVQLRHETKRLDLGKEDWAGRAVRASFAISWQSLDVEQKRVFALLSVFEGRAFSAPALAAVADMDRYLALDRLDALVALSLLNEEGDDRYRQHPLLAAYAQEKLADGKDAYRRMAHYFLLYARDHGENYPALQPEWSNMNAGIQTAYRLHMWSELVDYVTVLRTAWFARGRFTAAREAFEKAYQAVMALDDNAQLGQILLQWAHACLEQNDYDEARELLLTSLQIFNDLGDRLARARCLLELARVAIDRTKYAEAAARLDESEQLYQLEEDTAGIANVMYRRARLQYARGEFEVAEQLGSQALALQKELGNELGMLRTLRLLTKAVNQGRKDMVLAEEYCLQARDLADRLNDKVELAAVLLDLAGIWDEKGKFASAEIYARQSLSLFRELGDQNGEAMALFKLSWINENLKNHQAAVSHAADSLLINEKLQNKLGIAYSLRRLGDALHVSGQQHEAAQQWIRAKEMASELQHPQLLESLTERLNHNSGESLD